MIRLFTYTLAILIGISTHSFAQINFRKHTKIDDNWLFHFGHAANAEKDFNYSIVPIFSKSGKTENTALGVSFNDSNWRKLDLPHDWAVELPFVQSPNFDVMAHGYKPVGGLYPATSIGWYRKHFTVASTDSGHRFQLQFDGIFRDANIWVNGFFLGNNKSGYIGAAYDVTDYLNYDADNVIVVRADASQYEGWFYEGAGIYRYVWLNEYNNIHTNNDAFFTSKVIGNKATVTVELPVINENSHSINSTVYAYITDRNGNKIAQSSSQKTIINGHDTKVVTHQVMVNNPRLWSLEDPYLYRVVTIIKQGNKIVDSSNHRFGIRTITVKAGGVFLNNKYVKLKGTNNHHDHAGVGSALPDYLQYYRIGLLKQMGSNAYRTSHNAPTPELLDACDSLGMLVMDEQRLLNSSPEYTNQFERIIKRDRNHPSVFMWSIGNEEGMIQASSVGRRIAQSLLAIQQNLDPTRTSTYAADLPNVFHGVNEVIPVRGFNYRQFAVADYHKDHPMQPIVGTEMGSTVTTRGIYFKDTINAYVPDQDITAPWWASTAEAWWSLAAVNKYWLGGFIWTGFDYRGEPTPYEWPNISSHFGVMDVCGFPKNIYYYYQSWWSDKDVMHISPHWNWKGKEGEPIDVWVNSNADNVELYLNGRSLGKKIMPRNGHLQWSVPYQPGRLEAIGYRNNKKLTSERLTAGEPFALVATPVKTTMVAGGEDVTIINFSVVDKEGRSVPSANNLVKFSLVGDARIIGVGNGDPSSHEPDKVLDNNWQRRLFNGHCQLIVQAGKSSSAIVVTAIAGELRTATVAIQSSLEQKQ